MIVPRRARTAGIVAAATLVLAPAAGSWLATRTFAVDVTTGAATTAERTINWPSFRGPHASGVASGQNLPDTWNVEAGHHVRWKRRIPGLAHSSPIVWDNRVFVTSAVSSRPDATFKPGLYGDGDASGDRSVHRWVLYSVDKHTGDIAWERTAYEGVPREKRHIKATYANATPATDGRFVVAFFGSQGLYAYRMNGNLAWKKDLGVLNAGAYDLPEYEWGTASSPIIDGDLVIIQCDTQEESFILAADLHTGKTIWKTPREELPSWGTPTVYRPASGEGRPEIVTNGSNFVRGYDLETGRELWRVGGSSKITAPTPIFTDGLIIVASGRAPERPIFAIRPGAMGTLALDRAGAPDAPLLWYKTGRGSYMPTPIVYRDHLYVLGNAGIFDAYEARTGAEVYRQRLPHQGSGFSASPVAADGRLYLASEDGDIFVVGTGPEFSLLATNAMNEPIMATPALSAGMMFIRGQHHLVAIGR
jgi:outer membrane protein assembly factor BamB